MTSWTPCEPTRCPRCALVAAADDEIHRRRDRLPEEVPFRTSILGLDAPVAAYRDGEEWLDATVAAIVASRHLLTDLLTEHLPDVGHREPAAGYLAWLDFRGLGWGDDPADRILTRARLAVNSGPTFGGPGRGHARLNLACSPDVLTDADTRIAAIR